ncbi:MAG TPA: diguanylate cyclase [bacterium]|nr:diguanylate cyclase [bacterium]
MPDAAAPGTPTPTRVLVATPNPVSAHAVQAGLGDDWEVVWTGDGLEALQEIIVSPPRAAVISGELDNLSGLQLCQRLKAEPDLAGIPLLLVHLQGNRLGDHWAASLGVEGHVQLVTVTDLAGGPFLESLQRLLAQPPIHPLAPERVATLQGQCADASLLRWVADRWRDLAQEQALLQAMAAASTKIHDLPTLLKELLGLCGDVLEFRAIGVYWYETGTLYTLGEGERGPGDPPSPFEQAMWEQAEIFGDIVRGFPGPGELVAVDAGEPRSLQDVPDSASAFFAVPLQADGTIGVLGLATTKSSSRREHYLRTLGLLAQQMALVLSSALMYQQIQQLSRTDGLTGLLNRRGFLERATSEVARHQRFRSPFTVLLTDLDHFKQVNDTFGHPQGDVVLRETAHLFKTNLRSIDVAGRYGGEEFVILLPETGAAGGHVVAERLRESVAAHRFPRIEGGEPLRCTLSIGFASYTGEGPVDLEALIGAADAALYRAKGTGRNRVAGPEAGVALGPLSAT